MSFSLNTPPGTKVKLIGSIQVKNGILLLDDSNIHVLGGEVDHMVEKWELQRVRVNQNSALCLNNKAIIIFKIILTVWLLPCVCSVDVFGVVLVFRILR